MNGASRDFDSDASKPTRILLYDRSSVQRPAAGTRAVAQVAESIESLIESGLFDIVVVENLSRLSPSQARVQMLIERMAARKIRFISREDGIVLP